MARYREGERAEPAQGVHVLVAGRVQLYRGDDAVARKQAVDLLGDTAVQGRGCWTESALVTSPRAEVTESVKALKVSIC